MPSRASTPFLHKTSVAMRNIHLYQCPLGLMLHFYRDSGRQRVLLWQCCINALSGWGFISTRRLRLMYDAIVIVSMPFRAKAPFLLDPTWEESVAASASYQCPFGLKLHFYVDAEDAEKIKYLSYQCPFRLKLHFYDERSKYIS